MVTLFRTDASYSQKLTPGTVLRYRWSEVGWLLQIYISLALETTMLLLILCILYIYRFLPNYHGHILYLTIIFNC